LCDNSPEIRPTLPELAPWFARGAAHEDIGVIPAFLVDHAQGISRVAGNAATGEKLVDALARISQHDERGGWRGRIPCP